MLDLGRVDLDEIAAALADQTDYEHRWLINPQTGEVAFWTSDTGIDGQHPVDLDELDLVCIEPLASNVWYQDWPTSPSESATNVPGAGWRAPSTVEAPCAGSRPGCTRSTRICYPAWYAFRESRGRRRAVEWLAENAFIDDDSTSCFLTDHPDPDLP